MTMKKKCSFCCTEKQSTDFYKQNSAKDGLQSRCIQCCKDQRKEYYQNNKAQLKAYAKTYQKENKDRIKKRARRWKNQNREVLRAYDQKWRDDNREHVRKRFNAYRKKKYQEDLNYRLAYSLRTRLRKALRGASKDAKTLDYLGCSIEELAEHLEAQFQPGMSWENYGFRGWHIDHIIPLSSFDLRQEENIRLSCHFTNLQPLWAEENMRKGNENESE